MSAISSGLVSPAWSEEASRQASAAQREQAFRLSWGTTGDHLGAWHLLSAVFQAPTGDSFCASLEDPRYEPSHRIVAHRGSELVGHALAAPRTLGFGAARLEAVWLKWLAVLPEFRGRGLARRMLAALDQMLTQRQCALGLLATDQGAIFATAGWQWLATLRPVRDATRDVLSRLLVTAAGSGETYAIRPWRQVELPGVMRVYRQATVGNWFAAQRDEAYWRWLVGRHDVGRIWVALRGPDRLDLSMADAPIVGYAIIKDDRVLEVAGDPEHPAARVQLLTRACSEAIERDLHSIELHGAEGDALGECFAPRRAAGGAQQRARALMVRVPDLGRLVRSIEPELVRRARGAGLARGAELGLWVDGMPYRLRVTSRAARLVRGKPGRSCLRLARGQLVRLLLGQLDLRAAVDQRRIGASTQVARNLAEALLPPRPLGYSPVDEMLI